MFEPSVKVSVIVPVYKVEDYLVPCLDSILNQLFRDIEILLIDDGSPDKCGVICDEYAKKDNRVKVVHQPNSGVTAARRRGVEIARGEFIFFVDADDTLPVNSIQALYDFACRNSLDIAMGAYVEIDETGKRGREVHYLEGVYSGEVFLNELLKGASGVPWGNLYRTTLFDSKVLDLTPEIRRSEDFIMKTRLALRANLVGGTPEVIYYYLQRTTSVVHTFKSSFEYEKMYNEAIQSNADVVICPIRDEYKNYGQDRPMRKLPSTCCEVLKIWYCYSIGMFAWNKLVKNSIYQDYNILPFENINMWEDNGLFLRIFYYANGLSSINGVVYHYNRANTNAMTHGYGKSAVEQMIACAQQIDSFFKSKPDYKEFEKTVLALKFFARINLITDSYKGLHEYYSTFPESNSIISEIDLNAFSRKGKIRYLFVKHGMAWLFVTMFKIKNFIIK